MHFLDTFQVTNASFGRKAVYDGEQIEEVENNAIPMEDLNQPNDGTIHFAGNEQYFHNLLGFLHFWIFFKELLWFGIWVQKDFNFLPFLDVF